MRKRISLFEFIAATVLIMIIAFTAWRLMPEMSSRSGIISIIESLGDRKAYAQARQVLSPLTFSGESTVILSGTQTVDSDPIAVWGSERFALATNYSTGGATIDVNSFWLAGTSSQGTFYVPTGIAAAIYDAHDGDGDEYVSFLTDKKVIVPYMKIRFTGGDATNPAITISGSLVHK